MPLAYSDRTLSLVFTDLAGSTALKTERRDRVGGELIEQHRTIVRRLAAEGRIVDWAGDGCLLTFETLSAAVSFSLRLQLAHFEAPELPGVCVGIHMGEVGERPERTTARTRGSKASRWISRRGSPASHGQGRS